MNDDAYLFLVRLRAILVLACDLLCLHLGFAVMQSILWAHELGSSRAIPGLFTQAAFVVQADEFVFALVLISNWAHRTARDVPRLACQSVVR